MDINKGIIMFMQAMEAYGFKHDRHAGCWNLVVTDDYSQDCYDVRLKIDDNDVVAEVCKSHDESAITTDSVATVQLSAMWYYLENDGLLTVRDRQHVSHLVCVMKNYHDKAKREAMLYDYLYEWDEDMTADNIEGIVNQAVKEHGLRLGVASLYRAYERLLINQQAEMDMF